MSSADALTSLGSDLAFSVSYAIASELRLSAADSGVSDHNLIAAVLVFSIVLSALPASIHQGARLARREWPAVRQRLAQSAPSLLRVVEYVLGRTPPTNVAVGVGVGVGEPTRVATKNASLVEFVELLVSIARRIAMSLLVQLVAATAVARQPLRLSRILSLLSVAVFFLFLQSGASTAIPHTHSHRA
jgi:hypothetical protein